MDYIISNTSNSRIVSITKLQLATLAVELHGGGFNEEQVSNAMTWQSQVVNADVPTEFIFKEITYSIKAVAQEVVV